MQAKSEGMGNVTTVLGLLNAMIGGTILVLPLVGLQTGYINTAVICLGMGVIQFYTVYLIVLHLGKSNNLTSSILAHFNNDYKYVKINSFIIWLGFAPIFFIYFRLIVLQLQGLVGDERPIIAVICALVLLAAIVAVRIWEVGEEALAFGIISIIIYLGFVIWAEVSAPSGEKTIPPFGGIYSLTSTLMMAYSIQNIVSQNIFKNPNKADYVKLIVITFICGSAVYTFITYGAYAILNRTPLKENPETIEDYFEQGGWQVTLIEGMYLIHLFSAFPNFVVIAKKRFYELFEIELKSTPVWHEFLYIFTVVFLCLMIYLSGVDLKTMIEVNGSVLGFLVGFAMPIFIHIKCTFYDRSSGFIEGDNDHNLSVVMNCCQCDNHYSSKWTMYLEVVALVAICLLGLYLSVSAILNVVNA